jgi:hypothetical protein
VNVGLGEAVVGSELGVDMQEAKLEQLVLLTALATRACWGHGTCVFHMRHGADNIHMHACMHVVQPVDTLCTHTSAGVQSG